MYKQWKNKENCFPYYWVNKRVCIENTAHVTNTIESERMHN